VRRRSEPVDLPLLLSQTKYNWSLAAVEVECHCATHNMVAQCGASDQPKFQIGPNFAQSYYEVVGRGAARLQSLDK